MKNSAMAVEIQPPDETLAIEKSQGVCYRCASKDHFLNSRRKTFATVLGFAPPKKGGKKGKTPTRNVKMIDDISGLAPKEDVIQAKESGGSTPIMLADQENLVDESSTDEVDAEEWGARWQDDYDINATVTCAEIYLDERELVDQKAEPSKTAVPELVIDSGSDSTVVGKEWIRQWYAWGDKQEEMTL